MRAVVGFCAALAVPVSALSGCGGDKGSTASDSDGVSASESGSSTGSTGASGPTEASGSVSATEGDDAGSMSASMSGTTEISGGMSASMSGSEDSGNESGGGSSSTGSTGMISGGGETSASTSTTGEPVVCADLGNEAECVAADCMAISARPFFDDQATWCLDPPSFLACMDQAACDAVITTACKGQAKYQFNNGCLPPGFAVCPAPPDAGMDGYPDCN